MHGCRPLTIAESEAMYKSYAGVYKLRNQCLHILCITTGLRVHEALSLRVCDVMKKGLVVRRLHIARARLKRARSGRTIELIEKARTALQLQLNWLVEQGFFGQQQYVFRSRKGNRPLSRWQAWNIFSTTARLAGLAEDMGTLGTHSWRKTFADLSSKHFIQLFGNGVVINPLLETSRALGHASTSSTEKYLSFNLGCQQSNLRHMEHLHEYAK